MSMIRPRPMPPFPKESPAPKERRPWPQRRHRLKPRSEKKADWHELYIVAFKWALQRCAGICWRCKQRFATEGHHPFGQIGALILLFWPFCRTCHDAVHGNPTKARLDGWLY